MKIPSNLCGPRGLRDLILQEFPWVLGEGLQVPTEGGGKTWLGRAPWFGGGGERGGTSGVLHHDTPQTLKDGVRGWRGAEVFRLPTTSLTTVWSLWLWREHDPSPPRPYRLGSVRSTLASLRGRGLLDSSTPKVFVVEWTRPLVDDYVGTVHHSKFGWVDRVSI